MNRKYYKVIFADLDGTLIDTVSKNTFPKGIWDMQFKWDVLDKIKEYSPDILKIVTNQGGISAGFIDESVFLTKIHYICMAIKEYTGIEVDYSYCPSEDKECYYRKPNTGMLDSFHDLYNTCDKTDMLMIGDASGKPGQFSNSDLKTAENFGCDYLDVEDFVNS